MILPGNQNDHWKFVWGLNDGVDEKRLLAVIARALIESGGGLRLVLGPIFVYKELWRNDADDDQ